MISVINNTKINESIYNNTNAIAIERLCSVSFDKKLTALNKDLGDGVTAKEHLDALFNLAKKNHHESIELLQNLALGNGEVSSYAQNLLCKILLVRDGDGGSYQAACTVRTGCQKLITSFSSNIVTNEILNSQPKLLLLASSKIDGDGANHDSIPKIIKSKVTSFDATEYKPLWWLNSKLENGVFNNPCFSTIIEKDYLVKKYILPDDGACQFRASLMLKTRDEHWFKADKKEILQEVMVFEDTVKNIINESVKYINDIGFTIPKRFDSFFKNKDFPSKIYSKTIATGEFTLYSPKGIESSIGEFTSLDEDEDIFLITLADIIGNALKVKLDLPVTSRENLAYAESTGNHYNVIVPIDFFSII